MTAEENWGTYGVGAEISAQQEAAFDYLDAPVTRVKEDVRCPMLRTRSSRRSHSLRILSRR